MPNFKAKVQQALEKYDSRIAYNRATDDFDDNRHASDYIGRVTATGVYGDEKVTIKLEPVIKRERG